jgi:SNF2 family DNA or RNA helicase
MTEDRLSLTYISLLLRYSVLIFCQWKKMLNIIQRFTELQGWKFGRLDGSTNVASRQRLVDTFNNDESYFGMLMTTRTGGVGLNLTGADRIILYDPDWNPQSEYDPDWNCHVERNQKLTLSSFIP